MHRQGGVKEKTLCYNTVRLPRNRFSRGEDGSQALSANCLSHKVASLLVHQCLIIGHELTGVRKWVLIDTIKCCHADCFMLHLSGYVFKGKVCQQWDHLAGF